MKRQQSGLMLQWHDLLVGQGVRFCRDGTVYGCGSTEHGQLPYLKFAGGQEGSSSDEEGAADADADVDAGLQPRNEITIPTQLRLPFLQVPDFTFALTRL